MITARLTGLSCLLGFLVMLEAILLAIPFCTHIDNFDLARAVVAWGESPSEETKRQLEEATSNARRQRTIIYGVAWGFAIIDAFAILKVAKQVGTRLKNNRRHES